MTEVHAPVPQSDRVKITIPSVKSKHLLPGPQRVIMASQFRFLSIWIQWRNSLVLRFTTDSKWKYDNIVKRFTGDCELVMVDLSRLRDRCLVVSIGPGDVYVFRSGSNVFDEI